VRRAIAVTLIVLLVVFVAACDDRSSPIGPGPGPASLVGTQWAVVAADRLTAPVPGREPTLLLDLDRASGTGGCNNFSGTYTYDPATGAIAFRGLSMTATACLDHPLTNFERAFFEALSSADRLVGTDLQLVITGGGHRLVLVPRASDQPLATG
jgi:heat shock protein HslJ